MEGGLRHGDDMTENDGQDRLFGPNPSGLDESPHGMMVLVIVGMIVGLLSGMFGIGGGTVIVPALVWLGLSQRHAAATSMLAIVPTSISGVISYAHNGNVDWVAAALLFVGMFAGGQFGSWLLSRLPELVLRWVFVVFLIFVTANQVIFYAVAGPTDLHECGDGHRAGAVGRGHRHFGRVAGYWRRRTGRAGIVDTVRGIRSDRARYFVACHVPELDHHQCGEYET